MSERVRRTEDGRTTTVNLPVGRLAYGETVEPAVTWKTRRGEWTVATVTATTVRGERVGFAVLTAPGGRSLIVGTEPVEEKPRTAEEVLRQVMAGADDILSKDARRRLAAQKQLERLYDQYCGGRELLSPAEIHEIKRQHAATARDLEDERRSCQQALTSERAVRAL